MINSYLMAGLTRGLSLGLERKWTDNPERPLADLRRDDAAPQQDRLSGGVQQPLRRLPVCRMEQRRLALR
ncbi:hypothetical protein LMIY3S_01115 [Labrys miyagiensis]